MRLLHTSDWHLGRRFGPVSLARDHEDFCDWFVDVVRDEKPDLVVIAGDIYDRAIAPTQSIELFRETIGRILDCGARVAAITGNHDGPDRVAPFDNLLDEAGLYLRGGYERVGEVIELSFDDGPLDLLLLPYLDPYAAPDDFSADAEDADHAGDAPGAEDGEDAGDTPDTGDAPGAGDGDKAYGHTSSGGLAAGDTDGSRGDDSDRQARQRSAQRQSAQRSRRSTQRQSARSAQRPGRSGQQSAPSAQRPERSGRSAQQWSTQRSGRSAQSQSARRSRWAAQRSRQRSQQRSARRRLRRRRSRDHGSVLAHGIGMAVQRMSAPRSLAVAHAFVAGSKVSDSERQLTVGGAGQVDAGLFAPFSYTALGHLHRPQDAAGPTVRYSGSPLPYSFSEQHSKSLTMVEMAADGRCVLSAINVEIGRPVLTIEGTIDDLLTRAVSDTQLESFVRAIVTDRGVVLDAKTRLAARYPYVVQVELRPDMGPDSDDRHRHTTGDARPSPLAATRAFWEDIEGTEPDDELDKILMDVVERAERGIRGTDQ